MKKYPRILWITFIRWRKRNPALTAAGLSFFALFSFVPLTVILTSLGGFLFKAATPREFLLDKIEFLWNQDAAKAVQWFLTSTEKMAVPATLLSMLFFAWSSTRIFSQLKKTLDTIFDDDLGIARTRFHKIVLSRAKVVLMVLSVIGLFAIALMAKLGFVALRKISSPLLVHAVWPPLSLVASLVITTILFGMIFRLLPDARLPHRSVWVGATFTSVLFAVARRLLTLYFKHVNIRSLYGAAGSLIVLLIWLYFSAQIFLLGAEFTGTHARSNKES